MIVIYASSNVNPSARAAYERYKLESAAPSLVNMFTGAKPVALPQNHGDNAAKKIILAYENGLQ